MTNHAILRELNREIERRGNPYWWQSDYRVHPDRYPRREQRRSSSAQLLAEEFFCRVAKDTELLARRAQILWNWYQQRRDAEVVRTLKCGCRMTRIRMLTCSQHQPKARHP